MATLRTPEDELPDRAPISPRNIFPQGSPSAGVPIYEGAGLRGLRTPDLGSSGRFAQVPDGFGQQPARPEAPAVIAAPVGPFTEGPGAIPTAGPAAPRATGTPLGNVGEIPTSGYPAAPANDGSLRGSEFSRGISNTVNALAPLGGIAGAARGVGPISRGLQGMAEGITGAAALGAAASTPSALAAPTAPTAAAPVSAAATTAAPSLGAPDPRGTAVPGAGNVIRTGNSYTGGSGVSGDITVNGQAPGGGAISAQNMMAADNLAARETLRGQAAAQSGSMAARPGVDPTPSSANSWQARNDLRNLRVGANSIYHNQSQWGNRDAAKTANNIYENAANLDTAARSGADPGTLGRVKASADMYGDEQRASASRYGADASLRGTAMTAAASRAGNAARLSYDMAKDSRDFGLRQEEAGLTRQSNQLKSRQEAEKNMVDRLSAALPPGPDGKPNTAAAAEQVRAMTARVADRQTKLEQELAQNPGNAQAKAELANIMDNGVASVGTKGLDQFQTGMDARSLRKDSAGIMPWSGRDVPSNKPITSLRLDEGLLFDDYVDDQGGRIPARVVKKNQDTLRGLIR